MTKFTRGSVSVSVDVAVSGDDFWAVLRDWPAVRSWVLNDQSPPAPVAVELKEGHAVDSLPCTRVLQFDPPLDYPYEETLLYADQEAKRIHYTFNGIPNGMRNYMATTFIDETGKRSARVTCASNFDLPGDQPLEAMQSYLADVYEHMIIRGIEAAIQRAQSAS